MEQGFDVRDLVITLEGMENTSGAKKRNVDMEIINEENKHSVLRLSYLISLDEYEIYMEYLHGQKKDISISIISHDENGEEIFNNMVFYGLVKSIEIVDTIDGTRCIFEGISKSYLLDKEKRYISYQDVNTSFGDIIGSINSRYENISIISDEFSSMQQSNFLVQYNESDWEFLLRISSEYNFALLNVGTGIKVGFGNGETEEELEDNIRLHFRRSNEDYMEYVIDSKMVYLQGARATLNLAEEEIGILVKASKIKINNNLIDCSYAFINPTTYKRNKMKNKNIAGRAIEAKVVEILNVNEIAKLTVNFNTNLLKREEESGIETQLGQELYQFPYVTPYSQSHTGYFCTPEVDDNVIVYFPDEKENNAYVLGAVNSLANGRFSDRQNRNFIIPSTEDGGENKFEMSLSGDVITTTTGNYIKTIVNEEKTVSENVVHRITGTKELVVDGDVICTLNSNAQYTVADDYQVSSRNVRVEASVNFNGQGGSATNISGGQVNIEGESASNIKGGTVKIGGGSVSVGS